MSNYLLKCATVAIQLVPLMVWWFITMHKEHIYIIETKQSYICWVDVSKCTVINISVFENSQVKIEQKIMTLDNISSIRLTIKCEIYYKSYQLTGK